MNESKKTRFRWFQMSLRTFLLVVVLIAIVLGWFSRRMNRATVQREVVRWVRNHGGTVDYDNLSDQQEWAYVPQFVFDRLGVDFFSDVVTVRFNRIPDGDFSQLAGLKELESLFLDSSRIADLTQLSNITGLKHLHLYGKNAHDLSPLVSLVNLQSLDLYAVHEIDLSPLAKLKKLKNLNVIHRRIHENEVRKLQLSMPKLLVNRASK